jgi:nucleoid DNA-binding protein
MTKADIINNVSAATGLTKVETEAVLDGVMTTIIDS